MQISTNLYFDRSSRSLSSLSAKADLIQTQVSTGKRLQAPSSDSVAYERLQGLARDAADGVAAGTNLTLAGSVLQSADSTLGSVTTQLQAAKELLIQARSGTQSPAGLQAIGGQLSAIVDALANLANATDLRDQPLFGDVNGGPAVTKQADGSYTLAATQPSAIPIGQGQSVQVNESATRIFKLGASDIFTALSTIATALQDGSDSDAQLVTAQTGVDQATDQAVLVQGSLGARAARVEMEQARLSDTALDRESLRSGLEDTDTSAALIELSKTMTILSATQASFSKLSNLSLFDYLR